MEADTALTGRWHLHQGWERDLEMPPPSSKGLSQCGEVFNISSIGGVLSTPNGTNLKSPISGDRSTLSGGRYCTDRAVAPAPGVCEGSRDPPSPHPRGSVSAGKYSISVVPEGSTVNLMGQISDQRSTLSGGRYCTDRAVAPAPGVGEGSRDAPSLIQGAQSVRGSIQYQ